jgi:hypothetical protein
VVDLDELDRKRAALPPAIMAYAPHRLPPDEPIVVMYTQSAADILNAYPALAAEIRALRADLTRVSEEMGLPSGIGPAPGEIRRLVGYVAELRALRVSMREVVGAASELFARITSDCQECPVCKVEETFCSPSCPVTRMGEAIAKVPR